MTKLVPNRPTPEGRLLGKELARLADKAEDEARKQFPDQPERCQSCAFRANTIPNGCPETVMDALKCVMEGVPFMCHQIRDDDGNCTEMCMGWLNSQMATIGHTKIETPWPFSENPLPEGDSER